MGTKAIIAASFGIAVVSVFMVQTMGPVILTLESKPNFSVTLDSNELYSIGQSVHFTIHASQNKFIKYVWFFHDNTANVTTDGTKTTAQHVFSQEGDYLVGVYGFTSTSYGYPIDVLSTVEVHVQNAPPKLTINANKNTIYESNSVHFSVGTFIDPQVDTSRTTYAWDFGDGVNTTGRTVDHTYTNSGTYNVLAYATDILGQVAIANKTITVTGSAPSIVLRTNTTSILHPSILEGQSVRFDASATTAAPAEKSTLTYGWSFGNGELGSGSIVTEQYQHPGIYTTTLTVKDQLGASETSSVNITVTNIRPTITSMNVSKATIPVGQTLITQAQATDSASDTPRLNYNWSLDGNSQTGEITSWTPFQPENTTASLTVNDPSNAITSGNVPVSVQNVQPKASIIGAQMKFNLTAVITGDKWKAVNILLLNENNDTKINDTLVRQASNPWTLDFNVYNIQLDLSHVWRFVTRYTPNSTATNGADPVSLYLNLTNANYVYSKVYNFTFNVQQPTWYTWVLPLDPFTTGLPVGWIINYFDPGTTALTIELDHNITKSITVPASAIGPQSGTVILYAIIYANSTVPIDLNIADQYGLASSTQYQLDAPLNSTNGYRLSKLAPQILNITSTSPNDSTVYKFNGFEETQYNFTVNPISFYNDVSTLEYFWSFGDGQTLTTMNATVSHIFTYAGLYEVTVKVLSTISGLNTTQGILMQINPQYPSISLPFPSVQTVQLGQETTFNPVISTLALSEQPLQYYWRFNDSNTIFYTGYTSQLTQAFYHIGEYTGMVFAIGREGVISNSSFSVVVEDNTPTVTVNDYNGVEGINLILNPQISGNSVEIPFLQYQWTIDSRTYNQKSVNKYFKAGIYSSTLIVRDLVGIIENQQINLTITNIKPQIPNLTQKDYGNTANSYRLVLSTKISNLDPGNMMYKVGSDGWKYLTSNVINTTLAVSSYSNGYNILYIQFKVQNGKTTTRSLTLTVFGDRNGDNILDSQKSAWRLNPPSSSDKDGDGITDYTEIFGWTTNVIQAGSTTPTPLHVDSNPLVKESNGCIPDNVTYRLGGDPLASQLNSAGSTTGDGIPDCAKYKVGLPLNVAINKQTTLTGTALVNNSSWKVKVQVSESITGNALVPYKLSNGNLVSSANKVNIYNQSGWKLGYCLLDASSSCTYTYSGFQKYIWAQYVGNGLYYGTDLVKITPKYSTKDLIHNLGPSNIDASTNAKFTIIKKYVEDSGAFDYNSATGNYTINNNDGREADGSLGGGCYIWHDNTPLYHVKRGYCLYNSPQISKQELDTEHFDNQKFSLIQDLTHSCGISQCQSTPEIHVMSKMRFFEVWLSLKLMPEDIGKNLENATKSGTFTAFNTFANDFASFVNEPQSYFTSDQSKAKTKSLQVEGKLNSTTSLGFPRPEGLADVISGIVKGFIDAINNVWTAIVKLAESIVKFVVTLWNDVIGPVIGTVVHTLQNIANTMIAIIVNMLMKPILSADLSSPQNPSIFKNVDFTSITGKIDSSFSTFENQFKSMNLLNNLNSLSSMVNLNFNFGLPIPGILGQLVDLSGPGIIETVVQIVANDLLTGVISNLIIKYLSTSIDVGSFALSLFGVTLAKMESELESINSLSDSPMNFFEGLKNFADNVNFSALDIYDGTSAINKNGFGQFIRALGNIFGLLMNPLEELFGINTNNNLNQVSSVKLLHYSKTTTQAQDSMVGQAIFNLIFHIGADMLKVSLTYGRNGVIRYPKNRIKFTLLFADVGIAITALADSYFNLLLEDSVSQLDPKPANPIIEKLSLVNFIYLLVNGILRLGAAFAGFIGDTANEAEIKQVNERLGAYVILYEVTIAGLDLIHFRNGFEIAYDALIIAYNIIDFVELSEYYYPSLWENIVNLLGKPTNSEKENQRIVDEYIMYFKLGIDFCILLAGSLYINDL